MRVVTTAFQSRAQSERWDAGNGRFAAARSSGFATINFAAQWRHDRKNGLVGGTRVGELLPASGPAAPHRRHRYPSPIHTPTVVGTRNIGPRHPGTGTRHRRAHRRTTPVTRAATAGSARHPHRRHRTHRYRCRGLVRRPTGHGGILAHHRRPPTNGPHWWSAACFASCATRSTRHWESWRSG